jgi:hypothetical protein
MIRNVVRSTMAAFVLAGAVGGCSDSTGPDAVAGTYRLQRYEGQPLPVFFMQTSIGTLSVLDEVLVFGDDGEGVSTIVYREVSTANPAGVSIRVTRGFDYDVNGTRIEITFACPDGGASCAAGPHLTGDRIAGGLALGRPVSSKPASTYARTSRGR